MIPLVCYERNFAMRAACGNNREHNRKMRRTGNLVALSLAICLALLSNSVTAKVTASVDRDRVSLGDVLSLTIASDADENINNIDLRPLLNDFDILKRSTSSSTRVINGKTTRTRQVMLDITPKRQGTLRIPPLRVDRTETNAFNRFLDPFLALIDMKPSSRFVNREGTAGLIVCFSVGSVSWCPDKFFYCSHSFLLFVEHTGVEPAPNTVTG